MKLSRTCGHGVAAALTILAGMASCGGRTELADFVTTSDRPIDDGGPLGDDGAGDDAGRSRDATGDTLEPIDAIAVDVSRADGTTFDSGMCCNDGQNTEFSPDTLSGGASCAWKYVPVCDIAVRRIELHNGGGYIALRADAGGQPGAALFEGNMATGPVQWVGIDLPSPVHLAAGHVYWIQEAAGVLSEASSGTQYPYFCTTTGGWNGPYTWHPWTSRIYGVCS